MSLRKKSAASALNVEFWSEPSSTERVGPTDLRVKKVDFWVNAYYENIHNCEYVL